MNANARRAVLALVSGLVFGIGLGVSGMTTPAKVIGFLDVTGAWDPSLALVMAGAVGVHAIFVRVARGRGAPWLAARFDWPPRTKIEPSLVAGAATFGVGWGLSGYCPGPAIVSVAALAPITLVFVASMAIAAALTRGGLRRLL